MLLPTWHKETEVKRGQVPGPTSHGSRAVTGIGTPGCMPPGLQASALGLALHRRAASPLRRDVSGTRRSFPALSGEGLGRRPLLPAVPLDSGSSLAGEETMGLAVTQKEAQPTTPTSSWCQPRFPLGNAFGGRMHRPPLPRPGPGHTSPLWICRMDSASCYGPAGTLHSPRPRPLASVRSHGNSQRTMMCWRPFVTFLSPSSTCMIVICSGLGF